MQTKVALVLDDNNYPLDFVMLRTNPPQLLIHAWGQVPTTGWKDAKLLSSESENMASKDVLDLDFVATAPEAVALDKITLIPLDAIIDLPKGINQFRLNGRDNSIEKSLIGLDEPQQLSDSTPRGDDFVPIPWISSNSGANVVINVPNKTESRFTGLTWQVIDQYQQQTGNPPNQQQFVRTERAKISGGWLVRTVLLLREQTQPTGGATDIETAASIGLAFVPDSAGWS